MNITIFSPLTSSVGVGSKIITRQKLDYLMPTIDYKLKPSL